MASKPVARKFPAWKDTGQPRNRPSGISERPSVGSLAVNPAQQNMRDQETNERMEPMTSSAVRSVLQSSVSGALLVTAHPHRLVVGCWSAL
jgi:hypothetical protein